VQAAQEREELQMAGDALDTQITKAEAEVAALEGTLGQLQATNSAFGASLHAGDDDAARARAAALRWAPGPRPTAGPPVAGTAPRRRRAGGGGRAGAGARVAGATRLQLETPPPNNLRAAAATIPAPPPTHFCHP
jgi:hypothetical protein